MKTVKLYWTLTLAIAMMALFTQRAHALFTPQLTDVSNQVAFYLTTLPEDSAEAKALVKALKALAKPSTSVAQDYDRFVAATLKLGRFALEDPILFEAGSNTFGFFLNTAGGQIGAAAARVAALNDFVKTKKAASNQVALAIAALTSASTNNLQQALLEGRQVFSRVATANRLAQIGEEHSGFAPDNLDGKLLSYAGQDGSGTVQLLPSGDFKEDGHADPDGTFTYTRTGLNTGVLVLNHTDGPSTTTANLTFKTTIEGKFSGRNENSEGVDSDKGTFTIE